MTSKKQGPPEQITLPSKGVQREKDMLIFSREEDLKTFNDANPSLAVVAYQGVVYDASSYLVHHPGGPQMISRQLGTCIDQVFDDYEHSTSAKGMFPQMDKLGYIGKAKQPAQRQSKSKIGSDSALFQPDYERGLLWQLLSSDITFAGYCEFIKEGKVFFNPIKEPRLFESSFLEFFTRTPWFVIPIIWLPVASFYILEGMKIAQTSTLLSVPLGILLWTLMEYTIHRFVFHGETLWLQDSKPFFLVHFLSHGIHHAFPQDRLRLVFPPALATLSFIFGFKPFFLTVFPGYAANGLLAGAIIGYVCYDLMHYFLHHAKISDGKAQGALQRYWINTMKYHMRHHYKNDELGFGVSQKLWDVVFGTELFGRKY